MIVGIGRNEGMLMCAESRGKVVSLADARRHAASRNGSRGFVWFKSGTATLSTGFVDRNRVVRDAAVNENDFVDSIVFRAEAVRNRILTLRERHDVQSPLDQVDLILISRAPSPSRTPGRLSGPLRPRGPFPADRMPPIRE